MKKYRTEQLYGEGYRDAAAVMAHEVFEMQNTDILETLSDGILKNTECGQKLKQLIQAIECEIEDEELTELLDKAFEEEEVGIEYMKTVLQAIKTVTGKDVKYCLWLCDSIEELKKAYEGDFEMELTHFDVYEDSDIILSDIGIYGKLYGYEDLPTCIGGE